MQHSYRLLIALLALTSGCSTTAGLSDQMADWQGSNAGTAVSAWGAPEVEKAFGGETVLIWRDRAYDLLPADAGTDWAMTAVVCERMLAVSDSGTITGWRWRGDACESMHGSATDGALVVSR